MVTVATIILLLPTTMITAFASVLQTRTFRTNLVKGEYVDEEAGELEEPTQSEELVDEQLDVPENIGNSAEPEVETPIDIGEAEEEHETEVQSTQ